VNIRSAVLEDIPTLADLWQERRIILSQVDSRFRLLPDEREIWLVGMQEKLVSATHRIFAVENEANLVGYICGSIQPNELGLIEEIALDAHRYHGGLGRQLVRALQEWFKQRDIKQIIVGVPRRMAVEQAFWRSLGAKEWMDNPWKTFPQMMWMQL